jgi:hypothetical protein
MTLAVARNGSHDPADASRAIVKITGGPGEMTADDSLLLERLREPLRRALGDASASVRVRIETRGNAGEILVRITGARACLRLAFGLDEAEPGYVSGVVRDAVARFAL